jgi:hypothetical protein
VTNALVWIVVCCQITKIVLFADDLQIYQDMKSVEDCKAVQADVD